MCSLELCNGPGWMVLPKNLTVEKMVDKRLNLSEIQTLGVQAEIKLEPTIFR